MTLLVFGKSGQVARELQALRDCTALGRAQADLAVPGAAANAIAEHMPSAVINAAAFTAVDNAEDEPDLAKRLNGDAPGEMARACADLRIPFVHISTDYVFPGDGRTPYAPGDSTGALSVYGKSKLEGEQQVIQAAANAAILRTSWVFSAHGQNFVKTMLRLGKERDQLSIVDDQTGGPTSARSIAAACLSMIDQLARDAKKSGIYHFAGQPHVTWADFAREIFSQASVDCQVEGIRTDQYPTKARRPANSRLDCTTTLDVFGIEQPDWRDDLATVLNDISTMEEQT